MNDPTTSGDHRLMLHAAVTDLAMRYVDSLNRADEDALRSCFAPDAVWHVEDMLEAKGIEQIIQTVRDQRERLDWFFLCFGGAVVVRGGDRPFARGYNCEYSFTKGRPWWLLAQYHDDLAYVDQELVYQHRHIEPLYLGPADLSRAPRLMIAPTRDSEFLP